MKKLSWLLIAIIFLASCRSTRGYESTTQNYSGYGTFKPAPHKHDCPLVNKKHFTK